MTYLCRKERCSALFAENLRWPSAHLKVEIGQTPKFLHHWKTVPKVTFVGFRGCPG